MLVGLFVELGLGSWVGRFEGALVGAWDGKFIGVFLGLLVVVFVGVWEGLRVWDKVVKHVGINIGFCVGISVAWDDGSYDEENVGGLVGITLLSACVRLSQTLSHPI